MKKSSVILLVLAGLALAGCAMLPSSAELDKLADDVMKRSFRDEAIAKVDRLQQDDSNRECSAADVAGKPIDKQLAASIEQANLMSVKMPSDGKFLGDWKVGETIAQNGRGMTWTDSSSAANGGNCYNCHQINKAELSFGTIGPSLYNYGKLRGVSDPAAASSRAIVEYTWSKLWNSKAFNACSGMPRFGHYRILNEAQIKDVMALLLDPKSPVNE